MLLAIILSLLTGVTRTVSRMVNAQLSTRIGSLQSTFYNYVTGLTCSVLVWLVSTESWSISNPGWGVIPTWAYWGGAVGVLFVFLANLTTPKISAFSMTILLFVGQIGTAIALDAAFYHRLSNGKLWGGGLILVGLLVNSTYGKSSAQTGRNKPELGEPKNLAPAESQA